MTSYLFQVDFRLLYLLTQLLLQLQVNNSSLQLNTLLTMSQHELNSDRDPLLNTTPSSIRSATFFLKPFYIGEASMNFFGGAMSTSIQSSSLAWARLPRVPATSYLS